MRLESTDRQRTATSAATDTTVERLLKDPTAKGVYRANHTYRDGKGKLHVKPESEWVLTPVEAIVSEELWNQCNTLHTERKAQKQPLGPKPLHLFAGLLHCGCGQKMYVFSRSPKYVCRKCRNKIPMEDIEAIFRDELQNFFVSKEKVKAHLASANEHLADMKSRLAAHTKQLEKVRAEMRKTYQLYQTDQISPEGFGKLYRPLEDQERALAAELPKLQGQVDAIEIHQLAADDVVAEAGNLHPRWSSGASGAMRAARICSRDQRLVLRERLVAVISPVGLNEDAVDQTD